MKMGIIPEKRKTCMLLLPALLALFALTACSSAQATPWDNRFVERFHPTAQTISFTKNSVQNVDVDAVYDDLNR